MNLLGGDAPRPPRPESGSAAPARPPREPTRWTRGHVPGEVGIWVFIVGDMIVFSIFFGVFMVMRSNGLDEFHAGRESLDTALGAINTLALLTGSILVVLAVRAIRDGAREIAPRLVLGAMATGVLFIVDKGIEYGSKLSDHKTPGTNDFYTLFYGFTGIHLLHLLIGMGALTYLYVLSRRPALSERDVSAVESCASYWHLVDLLWVVLFPLFYLVA